MELLYDERIDGEIADVNTSLYIGARGGSGRPTQGGYDEIRMYNRAMKENEIEMIMTEGPVELLAVDPRDRAAVTWGTLKTGIPALHPQNMSAQGRRPTP